MEFIPETVEALDELEAYVDDTALRESLTVAAELAKRVAPDLAGVSIASREHGLTFTLVASDDEIAGLDGVQYLSSGPCVEAMDEGRGISTTSKDLFSEPGWRSVVQAGAAAGICSTLTLPIVIGGEVTGTVNLYGRSETAFDHRHQALAVIFNAWAPGAVTNADLSFSTRKLAEQAPSQIRDEAVVDEATGILAEAHGLSVEAAEAKLHDAAARAGIPAAQLARTIVTTRDHDL